MDLHFFFGPDAVPFHLTENLAIETGANIPFHGIISRGMLNRASQHNPETWHRYGHLLFHADEGENDEEVQRLRMLANECCVLSFAQSAWCVRKYLEYYTQRTGLKEVFASVCNIKEGHTSSVWKVVLRSEDVHESFVLNVARDKEAGEELKESSERLRLIAEKHPELSVARVYDIHLLEDQLLPSPVVVTRNEWIAESFEIHARRQRDKEQEELLLVERFLSGGDDPSRIVSVRGRVFTEEETKKIHQEIEDFLTRATTCLLQPPEIRINDGDVVWNGERAVVVAMS
jgi:hypothetical protein